MPALADSPTLVAVGANVAQAAGARPPACASTQHTTIGGPDRVRSARRGPSARHRRRRTPPSAAAALYFLARSSTLGRLNQELASRAGILRQRAVKASVACAYSMEIDSLHSAPRPPNGVSAAAQRLSVDLGRLVAMHGTDEEECLGPLTTNGPRHRIRGNGEFGGSASPFSTRPIYRRGRADRSRGHGSARATAPGRTTRLGTAFAVGAGGWEALP